MMSPCLSQLKDRAVLHALRVCLHVQIQTANVAWCGCVPDKDAGTDTDGL